MKRRNFLKCSMAAALFNGANQGFSNTRVSPADLDKYGGWKGKKFKATGFFRAEKEDRWWLVTPEGNAFISLGINHFMPYLFQQKYNNTAWQRLLGVEKGRGPEFNQSLKKWFFKTCKDFGFNTAGVHNDNRLINDPAPTMAYMQPIKFLDIPHWKPNVPDENFMDVFSTDFAQRCDDLAKKIALPLKDDPYLLGYSMTDCTLFTHEDCRERTDVIGGRRRESRIGFVQRLRNFPASSAGKQAYVQLMQKLYNENIQDFNKVYQTSFASFSELAKAQNWRMYVYLHNGFEVRDNIEFLKLVVDKYYEVTKSSIHKYDPNHMFVGDKLNANTDSIDSVLPVTSKYTDIIFYQMYARYKVQKPGLDRWVSLVDKPIINGDSAYTMVTKHMPRPYGPVADNLEQRAQWTDEFFVNAFARKNFVGWHYCGLIDATNQNPRKEMRQHSGLMTDFGKPYPVLQEIMKKRSQEMYSIASKGSL